MYSMSNAQWAQKKKKNEWLFNFNNHTGKIRDENESETAEER